MKNGLLRLALLVLLQSGAQVAFAQSGGGSEGGNLLVLAIMLIVVIIAFFLIIQVADNLMRVEAKKQGANGNDENYSIFPSSNEIFRPKYPDYAYDKNVINLKRGHDILLEGEAEKVVDSSISATRFAIQPPNFLGISPIPKIMVEVGDSVKAGQPVFFDKKNPKIKYVAPVSGEFIELNRSAKRSIAEVVILADKTQEYHELPSVDVNNASREELVDYLCENGFWPFLRQRPYNVIPNPEETPANIFISTFDSAPLAPDNNFIVEGKAEAFQAGLNLLSKLTNGDVHLGLSAKGETAPSPVFTEATGVKKHWFHGPHPAGNVGIQIHHIAPVDVNNIAWTIDVQSVLTLGKAILTGKFDAERTIVLTGAEIEKPTYVRTKLGANIGELLNGQMKEGKNRIISGDVLSGQHKQTDDYLNAFDDQITVIKEGDYYEPFGWLLPLSPRPSVSGTYPNGLFPDLKFEADTNTHGEKRAFVVTGQYQKMLPMDLYPLSLMKSIVIRDFEAMEGLGIYELVEEDVALAEFACTSKQPLQEILREGLDYMIEQG